MPLTKKVFQEASFEFKNLLNKEPNGCKVAQVAIKCDLGLKEVPENGARKFAHQNDLLDYETSSFWIWDED